MVPSDEPTGMINGLKNEEATERWSSFEEMMNE
jgi:hypothetical protein